ncbi:hypothetical protein [Photobacterium minamisatsumaniensis]|uniref:hypothetical protein n=1 Tax=Photobacterium minamisatsumaniensis TaxID=2910233 RepID=UPI003D0DDA71
MNAKLSAALVILLATFNVNASLKMTAMPSNHGTWVKITEDSSPVIGAEVLTNAPINEELVTDDNGRVFIRNSANRSSSIRVTAIAPSGEQVSKHVYVSREK